MPVRSLAKSERHGMQSRRRISDQPRYAEVLVCGFVAQRSALCFGRALDRRSSVGAPDKGPGPPARNTRAQAALGGSDGFRWRREPAFGTPEEATPRPWKYRPMT